MVALMAIAVIVEEVRLVSLVEFGVAVITAAAGQGKGSSIIRGS